MNSGRFEKGLIPWNKGLKGVNGYSPSRFKKGHINTHSLREIGSERISQKYGVFIKVAHPSVWRLKALVIY
jgi:hypothetical protein